MKNQNKEKENEAKIEKALKNIGEAYATLKGIKDTTGELNEIRTLLKIASKMLMDMETWLFVF